MTALGFHTIGGLQTIESGLNDLRRSQLMIIPEFKYMYGVIQKHHDDLKFAHITGKAKDLLDQAIRDTKFYNILIQMLCEVKQRRSGEQRAGLRQVYTWYMANKHVLYCGPRFGKEFMKDQAKEILQKAITTKNKKKSVSSREQSMSIRNVSQCSVSQITDICPAKENLDPDKLSDNPVTEMPEMDPNNNTKLLQENNVDELETSMDDSSYISSDHVLVRPKTAISVTISHLNEKSGNHLPSNLQKVTTMVHPLSTLVNPHAQIPTLIDDTFSKDKKNFISHIASGSKPDNLQAWQAFNKNRSYGQDIVGKLNFVGRSGTAFDVRYAAHSQGELPEAYTKEFLLQHFRELKTSTDLPSSDEDEENYFVRQTLEEFYQTADLIRPTTRSSSRTSSHSRIKSAKNEKRDHLPVSEVPSNSKEPLKLGHQLDSLLNNNKFNAAPAIDTGVKLNEVVNKIDSVSEEMSYFKEKLVPQPQHGYRQPSVSGLPTPREETTCMKNNLTQSTSDLKTRPTTSNNSIKELEQLSNELKISKLRCKSATAIDWRGKIEPDSVRYKWSKTKFGSHTYLKKWIGSYMQNSGSSSARKRPKTAPNANKEKWKTDTDKSVRAVQAASHDTTLVDQKDVDSMMTIQHLLPGDDGIDPRSLYDYDQKFWKNVRKSSLSIPVEAPKEFLSFVSPTPSLLADQKSQVNKDNKNYIPGKEVEPSSASEEQATDRTEEKENNDSNAESVTIEPQLAHHATEEVLVSAGVSSYTSQPHEKLAEDQIEFNRQWHLSTDKTNYNSETLQVLLPHQFSDVQLNSEQLCSDCQPNMKTARVERSAGRMPARSLSAHLPGYIRVPEVLKKAPPLRTPPSIPSPQLNLRPGERKTGQIFLELEHHARRTKSPRSFMQKVEGLRSVPSTYQPTVSSNATSESIIGTSLQVCRLPVGKKTPHLPTEFMLDINDKNITDQEHLSNGWNSPNSMDLHNLYLKQKHVSFSDVQQRHKTTSAPASSPRSSLEENEILLKKNATGFESKQPRDKLSDESMSSITTKSIARIGRPIAQVLQVTDPDELQKASQLLREASAAVDIQRIFRGYVARTAYKSLLSEERWKREDEQKAALEKQRLNKEHNQRMNAIYNRAPLSPEIKQWSNDVKSIQLENALKRQDKMNSLANEMVINQKESKNKISSIGPHVEIYDVYHPKQVGPTMKEFNLAATKIQKMVKGWMIRRKIEKLSRKATWYGSSFIKMAKEYKSMLKQVQSQHGVDKPKSPFSIREFSSYIDMRRRYESVYDKKAFSGELEVAELKSFFTECDLHPSQAEIDEALDVTTHGQAYKTENKGLKKRELLDLLFYIYVPPATGLHGTRKSTWMNPIIDGEEGRKLLGSEFIEPAPLEPCAKLVIQAKREQRQKEQAFKNAEERKRIEESLLRTEQKKEGKKPKQVIIHDPTISS